MKACARGELDRCRALGSTPAPAPRSRPPFKRTAVHSCVADATVTRNGTEASRAHAYARAAQKGSWSRISRKLAGEAPAPIQEFKMRNLGDPLTLLRRRGEGGRCSR